MSSDAPDTSGQQQAALQQAALSKEQLDWAKQIYSDTAPDRAASTARANAVSDAQLGAMKDQQVISNDYNDYNKTTFRPLEQGIVADAANYDTPQRREEAAAKAGATVETSLDTQRGITARNLARQGITPGSGKALALDNQMALGGAAAQAGAENVARTQIETIGAAKKMDAASLGRNLPANQATSAGIALNAGNSAATTGAMPVNIDASGNQIMNTGFNGAQSGLTNAASTYGSIVNIQNGANASNSAAMSGLGTVVGGLAGAYFGGPAGAAAGAKIGGSIGSDVNTKENIEPVSPEKALQAVEDTPVSNWNYKNDSKYADGGQTHTGPMAQNVAQTMGTKVAPGGKKIDVISMMGTQMAAIQGLSKKLNRVMAAQGIPA